MIVLALALAPSFVASPTPGAESDEPSKTVVVAPRSSRTATATATGRIEVTREELRKTGGRSLPQAIGRATGVWIQETNLGGGSPFIRGLTGNQVLILVDGIRVNDSTTRFGPNQNLNTIDMAIVDRVEVIRGPASVLYGSDAIGGVVLIWTKNRPAGVRGGSAGVSGALSAVGRTDALGGRVALELGLTTEHTGTLGIGEVHGWQDVRTGDGLFSILTDPGSQRNDRPPTGYQGNMAFASHELAFDEHNSLRATARVHRDFDVPRTDRVITGFGQTQPSFDRFDFVLQERETFALAYTSDYETVLGQARVFLRETQEQRKRISAGSTTERFEQDDVQTIGAGFDLQVLAGDHSVVTVGVDFQRDDVDSTRDDTDLTNGNVTPREGQFAPNSRYTSAGAFLQYELVDVSGFSATAGVRGSYFDFEFDNFPSQVPPASPSEDGDFSAVTGSLQLAQDLGDGWRLAGGVAQGFRAPNLDGLAKDGTFAGGTELHNADLDPEQSLTAEVGTEVARPTWGGGFTAFYTHIDDLVGRRLVDAGGPGVGDETYLRDNVAQADLYGAELMAHTQLGGAESPFSASADVAFTYGVQYDDVVDMATGDKLLNDVPIRRIPPLHGSAALAWNPAEPLFGGLGWGRFQVFWAANQWRLHPNDQTDPRIDPTGSDGWFTLDLDVGGPIDDRGSTWFVGVHNLLDHDYRVHGSGFDAPGIGLVGGIRVTF